MATELIRFTHWARERPQRQYNALMGMLCDPPGLNASFERQAGSKASGVDGMRKADYAEGLPDRLADLSARLRRLGYRPKPVRRVYIPKTSGGRRALGVPSFEDRLVQDRLSGILQAIWEPEFRDCSYGFRPQRRAHQALKRLAEIITLERTQWIVEADIKGFFDHVSHDHLKRFLAHLISDPRLLRIIERFLKAGVMEDGVVSASDQGTPQGGLVLPLLPYLIEWLLGTSGDTAQVCRSTGPRFPGLSWRDVSCFRLIWGKGAVRCFVVQSKHTGSAANELAYLAVDAHRNWRRRAISCGNSGSTRSTSPLTSSPVETRWIRSTVPAVAPRCTLSEVAPCWMSVPSL